MTTYTISHATASAARFALGVRVNQIKEILERNHDLCGYWKTELEIAEAALKELDGLMP
jgi:hypothetical protein